jgi:hypothetical protein
LCTKMFIYAWCLMDGPETGTRRGCIYLMRTSYVAHCIYMAAR